jgi:DNA-binding MarR family transcriptional regulator|tara:strand:+ start:117 stop:299 length:183 start_codon:yes stop_codon:yes gene_type:complete
MSNRWKNHRMRKLEPEDIHLIIILREDGMKIKEIAEKFEVTSSHVSKITKGKTWRHLHAE